MRQELSAKKSVFAIVQARMSSSRLPGKILKKVYEETLLDHLLHRLRLCQLIDGIVLATSTDSSDDPVFEYADFNGLQCYRGSLDDVASRLLGAAYLFDLVHLVRVSGDSPMLDPAIVDQAIEIYRNSEVDIVTNVQQRTFPRGQSVEVFSTSALEKALGRDMNDNDREHVTPYFYRHPESFRIVNFIYPGRRGEAQLSVDTEADLERFTCIMKLLGPPYWSHGLENLLSAYDLIQR